MLPTAVANNVSTQLPEGVLPDHVRHGLEQVRRLHLSLDTTQGSAVLLLEQASTGAGLTPTAFRSWHKTSVTPELRHQL